MQSLQVRAGSYTARAASLRHLRHLRHLPHLHLHLRQRCLARPEEAERHQLKPNVLLLGPSGVGKTHLMRAAARLLGVPFVRADATRFSATGYVGADAEDMVRGLLQAADGDVGLAEYGIVYAHLVDRAVHPA